MNDTTATYVGIQYDTINLSIFKVTPAEDGMETVEWVGAYHPERVQAERLVGTAKAHAQVTGSKSATYSEESPSSATVSGTWYRNRWTAPRLVQGTHRAAVTLSPEQAALKAEHNAQGEPVKGQRYVVAELSGYQLIQNRALDHRECGCGNGSTTYTAGTVEAITYWMDNSVEAIVHLETGRSVTVQMKAPSGDASF